MTFGKSGLKDYILSMEGQLRINTEKENLEKVYLKNQSSKFPHCFETSYLIKSFICNTINATLTSWANLILVVFIYPTFRISCYVRNLKYVISHTTNSKDFVKTCL